ncbi:MAG TPA: YihY/virulence factor BrkB family protein [Candidatus Butyricicoccus stercorigallinarum]|nr:YihY/virulence factor BrkB family protein [Candidatus Butyricicoccus stercorigallinarum]
MENVVYYKGRGEADILSNRSNFIHHTEKLKIKDVVVQLVRSYFSNNLAKASAELSYYLLFSIFPLLLIVASLLSLTRVPQATLLHLLSLLPGDIQRIVSPILARNSGNLSSAELIWRMAGFIALGIYFLSRTMSSIMHNVNRIYNIPNRRGGIGQFLFEILTAAGFICAIVCSFILLVLGRSINALITKYIEIPQQLTWLMNIWRYGRSVIAIGVMFLFLVLLCYLVPNCIMKIRDALPGAVFTLVVWVVCTMVFTFYIDNISRYNALYGSLSAIMVLMLWLYMTGIILFLGFELNFILMKKRRRNFICKGKPWYVRLLSGLFQRIRTKR